MSAAMFASVKEMKLEIAELKLRVAALERKDLADKIEFGQTMSGINKPRADSDYGTPADQSSRSAAANEQQKTLSLKKA